jgi:hypothetical protein
MNPHTLATIAGVVCFGAACLASFSTASTIDLARQVYDRGQRARLWREAGSLALVAVASFSAFVGFILS